MVYKHERFVYCHKILVFMKKAASSCSESHLRLFGVIYVFCFYQLQLLLQLVVQPGKEVNPSRWRLGVIWTLTFQAY